MPYVITAWNVADPATATDTLVEIKGRQDGLISWLLSLVGIEPTVALKVTRKNIEFSQGSLAGFTRRVVPIASVSSTLYGFTKPWQTASIIATVGLFIGIGVGQESGAGGALVVLLALTIAIVYYLLNKVLTLGFVEDSGVLNAIQFKRSVIENKKIDEADAAKVISTIQALVDARN
jgi:hypothetical protein